MTQVTPWWRRAGLRQGAVAELVMRLDAAHADCAGKLAAIRRLVDDGAGNSPR